MKYKSRYTEEVLNIFRTEEAQKRFWSKVDKTNLEGCWEWVACKNSMGYGNFGIGRVVYYSHILSLCLYTNELPLGRHCCHTCDNPACVRPDHLWWGTRSDNIRDCMAKGRRNTPKGELHGKCRITEAQALEIIRVVKETGKGTKDIQKMFPEFTKPTVKAIVVNQSWKHLPR